MQAKELFNKALVAASVAEAEGYVATSIAFREMAAALFAEMQRARDLGGDGMTQRNCGVQTTLPAQMSGQTNTAEVVN